MSTPPRRPRRVARCGGRPHHALGTPYFATDWSIAQLDAPSEVLARVQHHYYDVATLMYTREPDLGKLKQDVAAWLAE